MRKLIFLLAFLMLSCGARKAQKVKKEESKTVKTDSTFTNVSSVDLLKDIFSSTKTTTIKDIIGWTYEAPNETIDQKPFWMKIGKDSVNLASIPKGGKLHVTNDKTKTTKDSTNVDKSKESKRDSTNVALKKEESQTKTEKTSDIQREATNWIFAFLALMLGFFLPSILKFIINLIKRNL